MTVTAAVTFSLAACSPPPVEKAAAPAATPVAVATPAAKPPPVPGATPVTVKNFQRAETDLYFGNVVKQGGFGKLFHYRAPTPIDKQDVVRMNRDTLYSSGVFDLDAGPLTVTLPDTGKRFMSLQPVTEDHYSPATRYAPVKITLTRKEVGTRYVALIVRTLVTPTDPADVQAVGALQDQIKIEQPGGPGQWEAPNWDPVTQEEVRDHLEGLNSLGGCTGLVRMGTREAVDPVCHLLATATSWGLNPQEDAVYNTVYPKANDGKTIHTLTVKDVPVDGFWSISVYNEKGYFEKNDLDSYSINNLTAKPSADGSYTIQFGGCTKDTPNCLVTPAGWNYAARQYRPRKSILDGTWKFPEAQPVR
jgi:para-nitrobenzyl esterase